MPEEFDPAWEYGTVDLEVLEAVYLNGGRAPDIAYLQNAGCGVRIRQRRLAPITVEERQGKRRGGGPAANLDLDVLRALYESRLPMQAIADYFGVTMETVRKYRKRIPGMVVRIHHGRLPT